MKRKTDAIPVCSLVKTCGLESAQAVIKLSLTSSTPPVPYKPALLKHTLTNYIQFTQYCLKVNKIITNRLLKGALYEINNHKLTKLEEEESIRAARAVDGVLVGVDFIPSKNREKDSPYFLEVNNVPGLSGIEAALKSEGSVVKTVLIKLQDRSLWANA